jgi:hypothetical protein
MSKLRYDPNDMSDDLLWIKKYYNINIPYKGYSKSLSYFQDRYPGVGYYGGVHDNLKNYEWELTKRLEGHIPRWKGEDHNISKQSEYWSPIYSFEDSKKDVLSINISITNIHYGIDILEVNTVGNDNVEPPEYDSGH